MKKEIFSKFLKFFSTDEIENELIKRYGDILDYEISIEQEKAIFKEIKKIQGVADYLKATSAKDIVRYFNAVNDVQRNLIRGAYVRTMYLYNLTKNAGVKNEKVKTKFASRYAK